MFKPLKLFGFLLLVHSFGVAQNFNPFPESYSRLVQGISFSPDGSTLYFTLPHKEYLSAIGEKVTERTPRLAIYKSEFTDSTWYSPKLLSFSGIYKDYEPSLSPDGKVMLFNSNRPENGNIPLEKNGIWYTEFKNGSWGIPAPLSKINTQNLEQSYPSISNTGELVYVAEEEINGKSEYAIYLTEFRGKETEGGTKIEHIDHPKGSGDPWISPDGQYLIFTKYQGGNWQQTCDLYIAIKEGDSWGAPKPLSELNSSGPDFSPTVSPDGGHIFYRRNYRFVKKAFADILRNYF